MTADAASLTTERPALRSDLLIADIDGDRVVWDSIRRHVHRLNPTAAAIWDRCDGRRTVGEIALVVGHDFGIDSATVQADVLALLDELKTEQLLDDGELIVPVPEPAVPMPRSGAAAATGRSLVGDRAWTTTHGPFRAFDFTFDVCTDDPQVGAFLGDALVGLTPTEPAAPSHRYSFRRQRPSSTRTVLSLDGTALMRAPRPARVVDYFFWHLNRMAVRSAGGRLLIHAGSVVVDGRLVVMAAASGSGKSTLTAGLSLGGARYLSDECVGLDPATGIAWPYPKPITVERGSWHLFPTLAPAGATEEELSDRQWQVGVERLPSGLGVAAEPSVLVFPFHRAGQPTHATRLAPVDALIELLRHTFAFDDLGAEGLDALVALVTRVPAHRLQVGDLDEGVEAVNRLAADT